MPTSPTLCPLDQRALAIRRRVLQRPAQVSFDPAIWPGWWGEETALRAVAYLRDVGVDDDAVEAGLLLVGCAFRDEETDLQIEGLGGEVVMTLKVLQGHPSLYADAYWRELGEALPEHQLARGALQLALLDALGWREQDRRGRKIVGDAQHRVIPMLAQAGARPHRALARKMRLRLLHQ